MYFKFLSVTKRVTHKILDRALLFISLLTSTSLRLALSVSVLEVSVVKERSRIAARPRPQSAVRVRTGQRGTFPGPDQVFPDQAGPSSSLDHSPVGLQVLKLREEDRVDGGGRTVGSLQAPAVPLQRVVEDRAGVPTL